MTCSHESPPISKKRTALRSITRSEDETAAVLQGCAGVRRDLWRSWQGGCASAAPVSTFTAGTSNFLSLSEGSEIGTWSSRGVISCLPVDFLYILALTKP